MFDNLWISVYFKGISAEIGYIPCFQPFPDVYLHRVGFPHFWYSPALVPLFYLPYENFSVIMMLKWRQGRSCFVSSPNYYDFSAFPGSPSSRKLIMYIAL